MENPGSREATPTVSIVIPVYNGADLVADAIESALAQDLPGVEVIVVNDGSSDGGATERVVRGFLPRVRYLAKPNGGVATALNLGIAEARGEFVSWLSHDDLYRPDKLSRQVAFLRGAERERTVVHGDFDVEVMETGERKAEPRSRVDAGASAEARALSLLLRGRIHGCTLLVPRACFAELGGFDPALRTTQDYDYWFRMLAAGWRFEWLPGTVLVSRQHAGQGTHTMSAIHAREVRELHARNVARFPALLAELGAATAHDVAFSLEARGLPADARAFLAAWSAGSPSRRAMAPLLGGLAALRGRRGSAGRRAA